MVSLGVVLGLVLACGGCFRACQSSNPAGKGHGDSATPTSPAAKPAVPGAGLDQPSPGSPAPSPAVKGGPDAPTPETPAPTPETPAADAANGADFTAETGPLVKEGMSYEQVVKVVGPPDETIAGDGRMNGVVKWDAPGLMLLGKFAEGVLVRKTTAGQATDTTTETVVLITQEKYDSIKQGMFIDEVTALMGFDPRIVSSTKDKTDILQWMDKTGTNFSAKFWQGKLVRKTGFYQPKAAGEAAPAASESPATGQETAETPPEAAAKPAKAEESATEESAEKAAAANPREKRVNVVGGDRRSRGDSDVPESMQGRSYKPKAKLPSFMHSLNEGGYEVRLHNDSDTPIKAGLRAGKRGKDVTVPANGTAVVRVERGAYDLYYIPPDAPYELKRGNRVNINGGVYGDVDISLGK
jgi:hypothetical protein